MKLIENHEPVKLLNFHFCCTLEIIIFVSH